MSAGAITKKFFKGDYALWVIILFLCFFSVLIVYSSTAWLAQRLGQENSHYLFNQSGYLLLGLAVMWIISSFVNPSGILKHARFFLCLILLMLPLLYMDGIGVEVRDARRWIIIPFIGIRVNPFDFLRVAVILDLSYQLTKRRNIIYKIRLVPDLTKWDPESRRINRMIFRETTLDLLALPILSIALVVMENMSTAFVMSIMLLVMLALGNARRKEIFRLFYYGVILALFMAVIGTWLGIGRFGLIKDRVLLFFNENQTEEVNSIAYSDDYDVNDSKTKYYKILQSGNQKNPNYQRTYAKIATASGGLIGKGPGNSTLRSKLPNSYDDFSYAIVVEEYGFIGGIVVMILYIALLFRGITIAMRSKYYSLRLVTLGLVIHIVFTAFIHMSVATGNMFTTGQTLPLISMGGSSILANSISLGLILCISAHKVKKDKPIESVQPTEEIADNSEII